MYKIVFYETADGKSELWDFLENLRIKAASNKDFRLEDGIWELRPGNNRIFYFFFEHDTYVLLHQFRKKSQKTPKREIEKAKAERNDYLSRKETDKL